MINKLDTNTENYKLPDIISEEDRQSILFSTAAHVLEACKRILPLSQEISDSLKELGLAMLDDIKLESKMTDEEMEDIIYEILNAETNGNFEYTKGK